MEDCRVVELRHRSEPAEFPGELHEWEIPPDKGENAGGEFHRRFRVDYSVTVHTGIQERGDEDSDKRGI